MSDKEQLIYKASKAREKAYVPYSGFRVGSAVLTDRGNIYTGANIENSSYGATNCAERTAVFKAVSEGERKIIAIAIASDSSYITFPCGICRQVLTEFGDKDMAVICVDSEGRSEEFTLNKLLPNAFTKSSLEKSKKV